jgi:hypothetical protein
MTNRLPRFQHFNTGTGRLALWHLGLALGLSLSATVDAQAQTVDQYLFSASTGTFTPLVGGTLIPSIHTDDATSASLPIGFPFLFEGTTYTSFQASSNGLIGFSGIMPNSIDSDVSALGSNQVPAIAPIISDLSGYSGGAQASYLTTGTAPHRVLTMEWRHWGYCCGSNLADILSFQVKLYEGSGRIEMKYQREAGRAGYSSAYNGIGLKGVSRKYLSLSDAGVAPTASSTVSSTDLTEPATGQVYTFLPPNVWNGSVSTAWNVADNWNDNVVPGNASMVFIPAVARQPVVVGTQSCGGVVLGAGATLTLATNTTPATVFTTNGTVTLPASSTLVQQAGTELRISGDLVNKGATLDLSPASEIGFGTAAGSTHVLSGTGTTPFQNLSLGERGSGEVLRLEAPATVQGLLALASVGTVNVSTSGRLTLLSNATGTAQIVKDANSAIAGTVTVQRYITPTLNGSAGYRHYAAPILNANMASLQTAGFQPTLNPAYNTAALPNLITPFPTVQGYDQGRIGTIASPYAPFDVGFYSPAATDAMAVGRGYAVHIPAAETVAFTGQLANGNVTVANLVRGTDAQSGWQLLGNPYASVLDMDVVTAASTGLDNAVYVYQSTGPYAGTFQPYVRGIGTARYVASGQGFFMRTTSAATPGMLNITNAARLATAANPVFQRSTLETRPLVQLDLVNAANQQRDAAYVYFEAGATAGFDVAFDAYKMPAGNFPYIALTAPTQALSISGLAALGTADVVVPLTVAAPTTGAYALEAASLLNLPAGKRVLLRDAQTGTVTDLTQAPRYAFALSAGFAGPRFSLLITGNRALAVAPASLAEQVVVYPNPAHNSAVVALPDALQHQAFTLTLVNALGQTVRTLAVPASASPCRLSLVGVAAGVYSVRLATNQGDVTKRLVVE